MTWGHLKHRVKTKYGFHRHYNEISLTSIADVILSKYIRQFPLPALIRNL